MNKTLFFVTLLTATILCQSNNRHNSNNTTFNITQLFNQIQTFYNAQQFDKVFALIDVQQDQTTDGSDDGGDYGGEEDEVTQKTKQTKQQRFTTSLMSVYKQYGPIVYFLDQPQSNDYGYAYEYFQSVVYNNSLSYDQFICMVDHRGKVQTIQFQTGNIQSSLDFFSFSKGMVALSVFFDGLNVININKDQQVIGRFSILPVVSEYARQVNAKIIDPTSMVNTKDIKKFYMPQLEYASYYYDQELSLQDIASGLAQTGSVAFTEYLQSVLGLNNIDNMANSIGLIQTKSFYAASSLVAFTNYRGISSKKYNTSLSKMTAQILNQTSLHIHKALVAGGIGPKAVLARAYDYILTLDLQIAVSRMTILDTASSFGAVFNNLNATLDKSVLNLFKVLQTIDVNQESWSNQTFLEYYGINSQSTGSVGYMRTTKLIVPVQGITKTTMSFFVYGLSNEQIYYVQNWFTTILPTMIQNPVFIKDFASRLKQ